MVNEINKPSTNTIENEALRLRMENANRNIQSMQQEHDELLREMEELRQRAAVLSLRHAEVNSNSSITTVTNEEQITRTIQQNTENITTLTSENVNTETVEQQQMKSVQEITSTSEASSSAHIEESTKSAIEKNENEENSENAEYIRQKIEEIAALKAQFKRVQHMVNTSNMIEEHLSRSIPLQEEITPQPRTSSGDTVANTESGITTEELLNYDLQLDNTIADADAEADTQEKEELLRAMLNMFNDFTTDLRDQATTLRAERDRLRALRDEILKRRNQQS